MVDRDDADIDTTDTEAALEAVRATAGGRDKAARNAAIRTAVAAGVDIDAVSEAATLTCARVRQIAKAERARALARDYVERLRACLRDLLTHIHEADEAVAAAMTIARQMEEFDGMSTWAGLDEVHLGLRQHERFDLLDELREVQRRLRGLRRIGDYHIARIDPDRAVDWLIPTTATTERPVEDTRRAEIIRALPAWRRRQQESQNEGTPREWAATYSTYSDLYSPPGDLPDADYGDPAVNAFVRALTSCYTELRAHIADMARTALIIKMYAGLVGRFDLGFGVEPADEDRWDLRGGTWRLAGITRNIYRIADGYYRRFDGGRGAQKLTQPSSDHYRELDRQAALERIGRWHQERTEQVSQG